MPRAGIGEEPEWTGGLRPTIRPLSSSHQSAFGCVLMSPCPRTPVSFLCEHFFLRACHP